MRFGWQFRATRAPPAARPPRRDNGRWLRRYCQHGGVRWCGTTVSTVAKAALRIAALLAALSHCRRRCEGSVVPPAHRRHRPRALLHSSMIIYHDGSSSCCARHIGAHRSLPPPTRQALDSKNSHGHTASCARRQRDARRQRAWCIRAAARTAHPGRIRAAARALRGAALPAACRQPVEGARLCCHPAACSSAAGQRTL